MGWETGVRVTRNLRTCDAETGWILQGCGEGGVQDSECRRTEERDGTARPRQVAQALGIPASGRGSFTADLTGPSPAAQVVGLVLEPEG